MNDTAPAVESILDAMDVGFLTMDPSWRITGINAAAGEIVGGTAAELRGREYWQQFPEARELEFGRVCESVMRTREPAALDAFSPGLGRWFELRVRPVAEGIACCFLDVTARRSAERAELAAADRMAFLADVMELLAVSLDAAADAENLARVVVPTLCTWSIVTVFDSDGSVTNHDSWHREASSRAAVAQIAAAQHASGGTVVADVLRSGRAVVLQTPAQVLDRTPAQLYGLLAALGPAAAAVLPLNARGRVVGVLSLYADAAWTEDDLDMARDVAARAAVAIDNSLAFARAEVARSEAEVAGRRLALLARVSEVLSDSADLDTAVGQLARLVVPQLADWSLVTVVEDDETMRDVGYAHRDPSLDQSVGAYSARRSLSMANDAPRANVLRAGEPIVIDHFSRVQLAAAQPDPVAYELVAGLDPDGVATIPLTSRGRTFGVLTLVTTSERGPHTADEVATALEIGRRAGAVLAAARAAEHAQTLAESVQRGVLAVAPPRADLQIATRYRPANFEHQVGGDWYDSFTSPDGSTIVTIGDVMGHDVGAIAAMAQLRTFMQASAWTLQHSPAQVLTVADRAGFALGRPTFATALTADLSAPALDGTVLLRWSSAGHLPAVLITAEGSVSLLHAPRVDPPLGVLPDVERHEHSHALPPGAAILLYTDGLVERRDRTIDDGLVELLDAVAAVDTDDLEGLLDTLLGRLTAGEPRTDDVALIVVRTARTFPAVTRPAVGIATGAREPTPAG